MKRFWILLALIALAAAGCAPGGGAGSKIRDDELRLGYFANITHAQAVLGVADGSLERAAGVPIKPRVFASGPAAITALFAGEIDVLYVGPSPAVTGYIRSRGEALRVIAGAASGGAVFVVRPGFDPDRLDGAKLATPGLANTQDVALRHLLQERGLRTREQGGSVSVTPLPPAEILGLMARGHLDGAWVAEPWGARLVAEAGGVIAWDERELWPDGQVATTLVAVSPAYLQRYPDRVKGLLRRHAELTRYLEEEPHAARRDLQNALAELQGKPLPDSILLDALSRVDFTTDPMEASVRSQAERAYALGFLGARTPDLSGLFDLTLLKEVAP